MTEPASKPTYSIRSWPDNFESADSRKVKHTRYVCVPNRHDGKTFRRIARHPQGVEIYCAWCLILQVASKMPVRGVLADDDGPLDAEDLSDKTGFSSAIFDMALKVLSTRRFGWLCDSSNQDDILERPDVVLEHRDAVLARPSALGSKGIEGIEGIEGREERESLDGCAVVAGDKAGVSAFNADEPPTEKPKRPSRPSRPRLDAKPEHAEVRAFFCETWKALNGADYAWANGKDDKLLKRLLDHVNRDAGQARSIIDAFLQDEDAWVRERGQTFGLMLSRLNKYLARNSAPDVEENGFVRAPVTNDLLAELGLPPLEESHR